MAGYDKLQSMSEMPPLSESEISELKTAFLQQLNAVKHTGGGGTWVLAESIALQDMKTLQYKKKFAGNKIEWKLDGTCASFDGKYLAVITEFNDRRGYHTFGPICTFKLNGQRWLSEQQTSLELIREFWDETFLRNGILVARSIEGLRIFKRVQEDWVFEQDLLNEDWLPEKDSNNLLVLSFDGNALLVTSRQYDFIYIFRKSADNWILEQEIEKKHFPALDLEDHTGRFSQPAALDGNNLAIADTEEGVVYMFHKSAEGWALGQKITKKDFPSLRMPEKNANGGYPTLSLSLNGDTLTIGAKGFNTVYIFRRSTAGWALEQEIARSDFIKRPPRGWDFGGNVVVNKDILIVTDGDYEADYRAVFFFKRSSDGRWVLEQEISNATLPELWPTNDLFGKPDIANDGTVLIKSGTSLHFFKRKT